MKSVSVGSGKIKELLLDLMFVKSKKSGQVSVIAKQAFELDGFFLKFLTDIFGLNFSFCFISHTRGRGKENKGKVVFGQ